MGWSSSYRRRAGRIDSGSREGGANGDCDLLPSVVSNAIRTSLPSLSHKGASAAGDGDAQGAPETSPRWPDDDAGTRIAGTPSRHAAELAQLRLDGDVVAGRLRHERRFRSRAA
jgi:hypothetical protein